MVRITCYDMNDASRGYGVHSLEILSFCHSYLFVLIFVFFVYVFVFLLVGWEVGGPRRHAIWWWFS